MQYSGLVPELRPLPRIWSQAQSPLKFPITAHRHFCLDMFEGFKIWVLKTFLIECFKTFDKQCCLNILCALFIKHFMMNA